MKSDAEQWITTLELTRHPEGGWYKERKLGANPAAGESFQQLVPAGDWFGASVQSDGYALVGCTVAPGFDFSDFELASCSQLSTLFPQHHDIIKRLTRS